jgi:hydrogenase nickel incorporation protein HypA/HybF
MHESTLMRSLIGQVGQIAQAQGAERVVGVTLSVGALTGLSPAHLREHFHLAAAGTVAADARVTITVSADPGDPQAQAIRLTGVEIADGR